MELRNGQKGRRSIAWNIPKQGLKEPARLRLARIVHAEDVFEDSGGDRIARGLEAIATGLSLRDPEDEANPVHQLDVSDALCAWCRQETAE